MLLASATIADTIKARAGLAGGKKPTTAGPCLTWPKEYGGRDATAIQSVIWNQEEAKFQVPPNVFGIGHRHARPDHDGARHARAEESMHLERMARGDEIWCQLFSEPAAGSDLAGLRTIGREGRRRLDRSTARRSGPPARTSADCGMIVTRTDPTVAKHAGLTYFIVDMKAPGVEIRPIKQINGGRTSTRCSSATCGSPTPTASARVGDGWRVALTTLMNERASIGGGGGGFRART